MFLPSTAYPYTDRAVRDYFTPCKLEHAQFEHHEEFKRRIHLFFEQLFTLTSSWIEMNPNEYHHLARLWHAALDCGLREDLYRRAIENAVSIIYHHIYRNSC